MKPSFDNVHEAKLSDSRIRTFQRIRNGVDWGWFPDPWRFVRCAWEPDARRLLVFEEHSANKMMPAETGKIVVDASRTSRARGILSRPSCRFTPDLPRRAGRGGADERVETRLITRRCADPRDASRQHAARRPG